MAAGRLAADVADRSLRGAAEAQSAATRELQNLTSRARERREQRQLNAAFAIAGLCFGIALWYVLPAVLPPRAGDWLAASLIGGSPWYAGQTLMQHASPQSFDKMVQLYNACGDEPVELCAATITVKTLKTARRVGSLTAAGSGAGQVAAGIAEVIRLLVLFGLRLGRDSGRFGCHRHAELKRCRQMRGGICMPNLDPRQYFEVQDR
jgi:hypothetical protein